MVRAYRRQSITYLVVAAYYAKMVAAFKWGRYDEFDYRRRYYNNEQSAYITDQLTKGMLSFHFNTWEARELFQVDAVNKTVQVVVTAKGRANQLVNAFWYYVDEPDDVNTGIPKSINMDVDYDSDSSEEPVYTSWLDYILGPSETKWVRRRKSWRRIKHY